MERLERRAIGRVSFPSRGVLVICDTQEVLHVGVRDLGPIGVGIRVEADTPKLLGKDVIMVAETLIMYADVVRQDPLPDGSWSIGLAARKFSRDVLQYLFDGIEMRAKLEEELKHE
ncbi:MAG: hypothetical protein ACI4O0_03260 [Candidatus Limivicinus sp.]